MSIVAHHVCGDTTPKRDVFSMVDRVHEWQM